MAYVLVIVPLITAVMSAVVSWSVFDGLHESELLAQKSKYEQRISKMEADAKQLVLDAHAEKSRYLVQFQEQQHAAEQAARARENLLRRDLADAISQSDGMRDQLADAGRRLASAAPAAVAEYATTVGELLTHCSRSYQELAGKADGHTSDVRKMIDSWPSNLSSKNDR